MKLIFVARNALLAYLISSAVATFVITNGTSIRFSGLYRSRRIAIASGSSAPITTRSGRRKSSTALPSRRNSGFDATEQRTPSRPAAAAAAAILLAHALGGLHRHGALRDHDLVAVEVRADRARDFVHVRQVGAAVGARRRGDGDEDRRVSRCTARAASVVKCERPACTFRRTISSSPGSKIGISPASRRAIFAASLSTHVTRMPNSAKHAPVTSPT